MLIRSVSGIRATIGEGLKPHILCKYIAAFSNILPNGSIILGRDGRPSGLWLEKLVSATLQAMGREVIILGIVPTPTVQLMVEQQKAVAGISITASHNPDNWNGLKFINSDGIFLNAIENQKIWELVDTDNINYPETSFYNDIKYNSDAIRKHIHSIFSLPFFNSQFQKAIRSINYKVVVDAVNSSGSFAIPTLLKAMGCSVFELFCENNGKFPHTPEPLPENLNVLANTVKEQNADLGIAVDPDADRLVLIDENGVFISEELTIALATDAYFKLNNFTKPQNIVVNYSTSKAIDFIAKKYLGKVFRSAVGEINVINKMKANNAVIGGEGSGGVIVPALHYGRDSLIASALILANMCISKKNLSELVAEIPQLYMSKSKYTYNGSFENIIQKLEKIFPDITINYEDGLYLDFDNAFIHIRKSNTEPIVRAIVEAQTLEQKEFLLNKISDIFN